MKYLKHFANAQEATTVLATWPFNTVSSIQGQAGASINVGVAPTPTGNDHYIGTINAEVQGSYKILSGGEDGSWTWHPARVVVDGVELKELSEYINLTAGLHTIEIWDDPKNSGYYIMCQAEGYFVECAYNSMIIPDYVTEINDAFGYCIGLTSVTIPDGVTSIGNDAFYGCSGLTSVTIPDGVTGIGRYAFEDCSGLTSVTCLRETPPTLLNSTSFTNTNNCPIYVPASSVDTYKTAAGWSTYASRIQAIQ